MSDDEELIAAIEELRRSVRALGLLFARAFSAKLWGAKHLDDLWSATVSEELYEVLIP